MFTMLAFKSFGAGIVKFLASPLGIILMVVLALAGSHTWAYQHGKSTERAVWVAKEKAQALKVETATKLAKAASDRVVKDLEEKLKTSEERKNKVETVIQKVKVYVTKKADDQCVLTRGFEWVHNVSLDPGMADRPPGDVDEATTLKISDVAATVASNNAEAVQRGEIIEMWQEWYVKNKAIFEQYHRDTK